jgi:hypothetical protein
MFQELALQRMQLVTLCHTLDSLDLLAFGLDAENEARADEATIKQNAAGTAVAGRAAFFCTDQIKFVAQAVEQRLLALAEKFDWIAVDSGCDVMFGHFMPSLHAQAR